MRAPVFGGNPKVHAGRIRLLTTDETGTRRRVLIPGLAAKGNGAACPGLHRFFPDQTNDSPTHRPFPRGPGKPAEYVAR